MNSTSEASVPKVSVIMTCYNAAAYLRESIESILNQSFSAFELIIVDNASSDNSVDIIRSFDDARISLIENSENLGQTAALNIGLRQARGCYIGRMDADDIAHPKRLESQYRYMEAHEEIGVLGSWSLDVEESGNGLRVNKPPTESEVIHYYMVGSGDLTAWCLTHPTILFRRSILEQAGSYQACPGVVNGYPQDYDLWLRIARISKFANIPEPLLKYRIVKRSESRSDRAKLLSYRLDIRGRFVREVIPEISHDNYDALIRMLEYLPQLNSSSGRQVLRTFDSYFQKWLELTWKGPRWKVYMSQIKFYYLPLLAFTNFGLACQEYLKIVIVYPHLIFDSKFYKKLIKISIYKIMPEHVHNSIVSDFLKLR